MQKKYVFIDLDGTILDYNTHSVPKSAIRALKEARRNKHELVLTTGRPPSLLYGMDKKLGFDSYIAANGRVVVLNGKLIYESPLPEHTIDRLVEICHNEHIDIAYEGMEDYALESNYSDLYKSFSDHFNLIYPVLQPGFYKGRKVYQINMFYDKPDYKRFRELVPELSFEYSCKYGLDVNTPGGFKDVGIREIVKYANVPLEDVIAIGDGYNDVSMLQYAQTSVAMGNAYKGVSEHATFTTDRIEKDGLYKAFKKLKLI